MNCYNHNNYPAVGICKHCNKGICPECLVDSGDGIACHGNCLEEVKMINKLISHNKKLVKGTTSNWNSAGVLYISLGSIFILSCLFYLKRLDPFLITLGIVFLAYGLYSILKGRTYKEDPRDF